MAAAAAGVDSILLELRQICQCDSADNTTLLIADNATLLIAHGPKDLCLSCLVLPILSRSLARGKERARARLKYTERARAREREIGLHITNPSVFR